MSEAVAVPVAAAAADPADARRARFRTALSGIARSSSDDLLRWVMVPASIALIAGFNFMLFGWIGASRTHREIEQIPYLISGGLVGLALVVLGGVMLASAFWVMVMRRMQEESEERARAQIAALEARLAERSQNGRQPHRRRSPLTAAPPPGADD